MRQLSAATGYCILFASTPLFQQPAAFTKRKNIHTTSSCAASEPRVLTAAPRASLAPRCKFGCYLFGKKSLLKCQMSQPDGVLNLQQALWRALLRLQALWAAAADPGPPKSSYTFTNDLQLMGKLHPQKQTLTAPMKRYL